MILDVGCGWHKTEGALGIDLNLYDRIHKARNDPDVVASADCLPFVAGSFSEIHCYEVLEHLYFPYLALVEFSRCLAESGRVFLSIPNPYWIMRTVRHWFHDYADYGASDHINGWTFAEIKSLVSRVPFVITGHHWGSWWYRVNKWPRIKKLIARYFKHITNYSLFLELRKC